MGISSKLYLFFFFPVLLFSGCASAQNYPERRIKGEDYFVYTVEPGNTVYAISKLFSVDVNELVKANPEAASGLSIGQEILVPKSAIDRKAAKQKDISVQGEFILHTVQRKETLFGISKDYGVDLNSLMEANPEAAKSLSTGSVIKVPVQKSTKTQEVYLAPAANDTFLVHQVQIGETAFSLAKAYNVSLDSLQMVNNNFADGLKTGQWIVIPKYKESYLATLEPIEEEKPKFIYPKGNKEVYDLALLLPFELEMNDSLEKSLMQRNELYILTEIALEYYRGTQLALDSLKKLGFNANVYVYDVGENAVEARDVMKRPEARDFDMVFGPMHKTSLAVVSDLTKEKEIYLVSPNSFANEVFEDNPYLLRAVPSRETTMRYLANYIAIQHQADNVIMISSESSEDWPLRKLFKEAYNSAVGAFPNAVSDSLRSATKSITKPENAELRLKKDVPNVLVVPSNELAFVSDFMTRLSRLSSDYDIRVYGLDNWLRYDNIDAEYKNRFKLRLVVPNHIEYSNQRVIDFLKKYRAAYQMEPSQYGYGYLGYDLTMFFGMALLREGLGFPRSFENMEMQGLGAAYRFGRSTTGKEFENKSIYILEYKDFEIQRVN